MQKSNLRKEKVLELLVKEGELSAHKIAETFDMSLTIARRLCASLSDEGKVMRTHGGIRIIPSTLSQYLFKAKVNEHPEEKSRIAKYASSLVSSGEVLYLETGSTMEQFAIELAARIQKGELHNLVIYTNSLVNLNILSPICEVSLIGGIFRPERQYFVGFLGERLVSSLHFDHCFMGTDAITIEDGIMTGDSELLRLDILLVGRSNKITVLADSSKFQKYSLISVASLDAISMIITDNALPTNVLRKFERASKVNIVRV